jgi:site-specific DNA-methyltransferase (adenine-specific)
MRQGDCLGLMRALPDASVDMILCDLPYGTTQCAWDAVIPFAPMWAEYLRVSKPTAAIVLTAAQPFTSALIMSNPGMFRYDWVWEKGNATGFLNAKKQPLRAHESVVVFYKTKPTYNPQMTHGHERKTTSRKIIWSDCYGVGNALTTYDSTSRYPRTVQQFSSDKQKSSLHPTQKPVGLMEYLIRTYTNEGDTVLDNCMGSGTTGVACMNTGRNFIGFELDEGYFQVARERVLAAKRELGLPNT